MITWEEAEDIIVSKQLDRLVRSPAQSAEYRRAKESFTRSHGGTAQFVLAERLKWSGDCLIPQGATAFANLNDLKILLNDFSYDFEPSVKHFVVWSKIPIPCGKDEFPTQEACDLINQFLTKYFIQRANIQPGDLQWFKNTVALQSIPSVSHFHVLVRNCDDKTAQHILAPLK